MTREVRRVELADIMSLRVKVLRKGTPSTHCNYPEDLFADVVHLAIVEDHVPIATSTWFSKECPERPGVAAVQLKGMAVDDALQGSGLGALLVATGLDLARSRRAQLVWARARDSALGFYERLGFTAEGEGFVDEPTGMPHHIVTRAV